MTAVYSPQKVVPSLSRPFTRWHTLHPTGDQPFVTRSLDFPFSARFHRDDTDTSSPRRPSFPSSSLPSPLVTPPPPSMRRGETILRRRRDRTRRWCLFSVRSSASDTDTALERYSSIRGEGSFSPPPGRGEAVRFPRERHCHCHSLTNRYEAVPIRYIIPRTCNASVATSPGL